MKFLSFNIVIVILTIANASTPTKKVSAEEGELKFHHENDVDQIELDDWINEEVYSKRSVQNHQHVIEDEQTETKESSLPWSLWDKLSRIALSLCKQIFIFRNLRFYRVDSFYDNIR